MKVRSDFVTNSSSSSFILGFTSEKTIVEELHKNIPSEKLFRCVYDDVMKAKRMSKQDVADLISNEKEYSAKWIAEDNKRTEDIANDDYKGSSFYYEWADSEAGIEEAKKIMDKWLQEAASQMEGRSVFVEVEYGDHTDIGSTLEHDVLPAHPNTITRISYH